MQPTDGAFWKSFLLPFCQWVDKGSRYPPVSVSPVLDSYCTPDLHICLCFVPDNFWQIRLRPSHLQLRDLTTEVLCQFTSFEILKIKVLSTRFLNIEDAVAGETRNLGCEIRSQVKLVENLTLLGIVFTKVG